MTGSLFPDVLNQLLDEFSRSDIRELHIRKSGFELYFSKDPRSGGVLAPLAAQPAVAAPSPAAPAAPAPVPSAPAQPSPASDIPAGATIINAPNLGTFYRAPKPGAANYVEIGSRIGVGDELCLIEVMKLFTALRSEVTGTIHSVLVEDGAMVEGGQPLFAVVRD
ncbi:MAG: acetyl-CoA carboxylase biotin carboxyl carrier protein [Sphingobium sp.]